MQFKFLQNHKTDKDSDAKFDILKNIVLQDDWETHLTAKLSHGQAESGKEEPSPKQI